MRLLLLSTILFSSFIASSQRRTVQSLLGANVIDVEAIDTSKVKSRVAWIGFGYGRSKIEHLEEIEFLANRKISKVVYTYSDFKEVRTFKQRHLDSLRYEQLLRQFPQLLTDNDVEWQTIRQTLKSSKTDAQQLFHGFIIYSKSNQKQDLLAHLDKDEPELKNDASTREDEINMVKETLGLPCVPEVVKKDSLEIETGKYLPVRRVKREKGIVYGKQGIWKKRQKQLEVIDLFDTIPCSYDYQSTLISDSVVYSTLKRKNWKKAVLVQDVTGSMNGYLAQTFMWQRKYAQETGISRFVFFNDGDDHPDGSVGGSGGMDKIESRNSSEVENLAYGVMARGNGGEDPENDIEALYYAMRVYPDAEAFILIADNTSNVRDMELLKKLNKPVHIIICGSSISENVHPHYLKLALHTQGSIHTLHRDIENLQQLKEGGKIRIGRQLFEKKGNTLKKLKP